MFEMSQYIAFARILWNMLEESRNSLSLDKDDFHRKFFHSTFFCYFSYRAGNKTAVFCSKHLCADVTVRAQCLAHWISTEFLLAPTDSMHYTKIDFVEQHQNIFNFQQKKICESCAAS